MHRDDMINAAIVRGRELLGTPAVDIYFDDVACVYRATVEDLIENGSTMEDVPDPLLEASSKESPDAAVDELRRRRALAGRLRTCGGAG